MGCGCGMTCWRRLHDWNEAGVWSRLHQALLAKLQGAQEIDWSRASVDSTFARAFGGVDGNGIPLAVDATPANVPEVKELLSVVDGIEPVAGRPGRPRRRPENLYGDRAYCLLYTSPSPRDRQKTRMP